MNQRYAMESLPIESKKITAALFVSKSLASAGRIATSAILTIIAFNITQDRATVGWPGTIINFSAAPAALLWGYIWDKIGRRKGLTLGILFGMVGTIISVFAIIYQSFTLLLIGMVGMGIAGGVSNLARFIAAEVTPKNKKAQAISIVVFSGTIGAIFGPLLIAPTTEISINLGWDPYLGIFIATSILFFLSALVIFMFLKPEPLEIAKKYEDAIDLSKEIVGEKGRSILEMFKYLEFNVAFIAMVFGQIVMVMVMRLSALHIVDIGHPATILSVSMSAHTLGMFAFSFYTGKLTDKLGYGKVILIGTLLLYISFYLAATASIYSTLIAALFLLGLGWNFCFVSGSAMLSSQLAVSEKSRVQGFNDLFLALGSGLSGLLAAKLYNQFGFVSLNIISAVITIAPLLLTLLWMRSIKKNKSR